MLGKLTTDELLV